MKKIKLILSLFVLALLAPSCEKDGGDSVLDLTVAGFPRVTKVADSEGFIDLIAVNNDDPIALSFTIDEQYGDIASMEVVGYYFTATGDVYKAVIDPNLTTFPKTYTITATDLFTYFDELNSAEDLAIGDKLTITANVTLDNGQKFDLLNAEGKPNYGSNFAVTPYSPITTYNVACPSDLGGTYSALTSGSSTDPGPSPSENPIANFPYTVTLTDNGGGSYTISDAFGGVYMLWYDIYGLNFEVEGTFSDVCGTISGEFPEPFGTQVIYTGSVDSETGVITINWVNGYDDTGVTILTPQ